VIAARASAIPEVVGDAGVLCAPKDAAAFSEAVAAVLTQPVVMLRERSIRRAANFTWERAARATLEVYRECASRTSR
jgi:glycosyltransferase involved in cell wall biosynthesis